jgi:hypothetical protein
MSLTFKETVVLHHTSLRNVGVYTSMSLALLGVSRVYREKGNELYNNAFIIISLIANALAIATLHNQINQMSHFISKMEGDERKMAEAWLDTAKMARLIVYPIVGLTMITFYRQYTKK